MTMPSTLIERLRHRARAQADETAFIFLEDGEREVNRLTYRQLEQQAIAIASQMQASTEPGDRALLLYPPGLEFVTAFFGCLYAGVIAVPAYPPRPNRSIERLLAIATDAQANLALTTPSLRAELESRKSKAPQLSTLQVLDPDGNSGVSDRPWQEPNVSSQTLAFLQYTSGSTGRPKGVMVSHGNLIQNSEYIKQAFELTSQSVSVTWLPSFHDMGLIDGILQPIYSGFLGVVMSPAAFVQKPIRWLRAISHYRATHCGGPNFGYDLCVRKITPEQREGLDLSSWTSAYSGAEPVRQETLEQFVATFAPYGFRRQFFYPCYGMAEATLMVSGGLVKEEPVYCPVQADALEENRIVPASPETENVRTIVGCGRSWLDAKIAIVDPEALTQCAPGEVGEIWVSGESVAQGYWQRPDATQETFAAYLADTGEGPFLRTGDLGFLQGEELFVTGRLKDVIIVRGRNHYPQDIELTAEKSHPSLRPNCGAAFTVEVDGEEQLVVAQEVERTYLRKLNVDEVTQAIRKAVASEHELQVHAIALLKTNSIPKTSSGKIQRHACRKDFLAGNLKVVGEWSANTVPAPDGTPDTSSSAAQLHNALYGPLRVPPLPLPADAAPAEATPAQTSKTRADRLMQWLRDYAKERLNSQLIDQRRCIPPYIVLDLGNRGVLGMQIPESYGGMGLSNYDALRVIKQLASIDLNLASFVGVNHALGTRPILNYAREEVRREFLPLIARGLELASFAITEPGAGSNPRAIASAALPTPDGGWRLQGQKIWIGSGSWSGLLNVFVQLYDGNHQPQGITGFVVRQGTPGLEQGPEALTMGMRGMVQNAVHLNDVPVVTENLLGQIGDGMSVAQDAMLFGRLGIGFMSVGGMKRALQLMLRYAENRSVSTGRLLDNPFTRVRLSDLSAAVTAVDTLVSRLARLMDQGCAIPVEAYAACKTSGPEFFWQAADTLIQLLGGRGYIETNIAPQLLRDARLLRIFEGPTEPLHMFMGSRVLNQGQALQQFLDRELGAPGIFATLYEAAQQIYERCTHAHSAFGDDRTAATRWAALKTGELTTFAILQAALQGTLATVESPSLRRALDWARLHFEQTYAQALRSTPAEAVLSTPDELKTTIADYAAAIGEVEQTLAGEDWQLDELLQKQPGQPSQPPVENGDPSESIQLDGEQFGVVDAAATRGVAAIQNWIADWLMRKLRLASSQISPDKSFADYGIDSVMAVDLAFELGEWLQQDLEATILWNFPTIKALAQHLAASATPQPQPDLNNATDQSPPETAASDEDLDELSDDELTQLLAQEIAAAQSTHLR